MLEWHRPFRSNHLYLYFIRIWVDFLVSYAIYLHFHCLYPYDPLRFQALLLIFRLIFSVATNFISNVISGLIALVFYLQCLCEGMLAKRIANIVEAGCLLQGALNFYSSAFLYSVYFLLRWTNYAITTHLIENSNYWLLLLLLENRFEFF
jgi:hypothetical protein